MNADQEEQFVAFENKVDEVMQILNLMSSDDLKQSEEGVEIANRYLEIDVKEPTLEKVDIENFLVKNHYDRTVINTADSPTMETPIIQDKNAFMASIEKDANRRNAERKQRENLAQDLRKLGNQAFRNGEYEKAVTMYSKALDQVRDSPILYNNRALSFIRLSLFKRAIIDCDFVLNKLDEKNLRAWLYRAKAYYLLEERRLYEKSIFEAKKHHPKELAYIEKIVKEIERSSMDEDEENCDDDDRGSIKDATLTK